MKTLLVPFAISPNGGLATTESTVRIIEQQIIDILVTAHYERPMNPDYGAGVPEFIFVPIRSQITGIRAHEIKEHLASIVSLADIVSVTLTESPTNPTQLSLDVKYTVRPSTQVFSVTTTVTGIVTDETWSIR